MQDRTTYVGKTDCFFSNTQTNISILFFLPVKKLWMQYKYQNRTNANISRQLRVAYLTGQAVLYRVVHGSPPLRARHDTLVGLHSV